MVSPVGIGIEQFWTALMAGKNGVAPISGFDTTDFSSKIAAEVKDFDPGDWVDAKIAKRTDRFIHFSLAASTMAVEDAGLDDFPFDGNRAGVIIGSGIGGSATIEDGHDRLKEKGPRGMSPFFISKLLINMGASMVSIKYGLKGHVSALSMACSTGANAIGDAARILERGDADIMLAGGSEASITPLAYGGFCATRSMSRRNDQPEKASRPFDKNRDGFVMGEGAGVAVLETLAHARGRGARIYAELAGYGNTTDAYHFTAPQPSGDGMARSMLRALDDGGISPGDVGYINAHGTSTILNDKIESLAIQKVFDSRAKKLKISSIKSMIGHLLAASGAVEFTATVMSIFTGVVPPTINYEEPDPECPLDYVIEGAEAIDLEVALSNSFGFGGGNVTLAVRKFRSET